MSAVQLAGLSSPASVILGDADCEAELQCCAASASPRYVLLLLAVLCCSMLQPSSRRAAVQAMLKLQDMAAWNGSHNAQVLLQRCLASCLQSKVCQAKDCCIQHLSSRQGIMQSLQHT